jgi:hypothetical protein
MVRLVEQMLVLHTGNGKLRTPHKQSVLTRQIATTARQIDWLVYEVYGLTEEESRIVEIG